MYVAVPNFVRKNRRPCHHSDQRDEWSRGVRDARPSGGRHGVDHDCRRPVTDGDPDTTT